MGGLQKSPIKTDEKGKYYLDQNGQRVPWGEQPELAPIAPGPTDEALRKRRSAALTQAGLGMGRRSTLLTQGLTDTPVLGKTMLGGY